MAKITTTQSFANGDTVTSTKLNNIIANASFDVDAVITGGGISVDAGALKLTDSGVTTAKIQNDAVTFAKMQNSASAGLSVVGRSANSAGDFAEISASTDNHVLRRSGSSIGWGLVAPANLSQPITRDSNQATTSGTQVSWTSIPDWVKMVTMVFDSVSTNGNDNLVVQLGTASSYITTGYKSGSVAIGSTGAATWWTATYGFALQRAGTANSYSGVLTIANRTANLWSMSGTLYDVGSGSRMIHIGGDVSLGDPLTRIRLLMDGANTFDNGQVNIIYQ
jgi:hypothetical protein